MQVKSLRSLNLKGSLEQFSATMTAQTDLRVEAVHLRRFFRNFVGVRQAVTPPFPLPGYESESVLVETFEAGGPCLWLCKGPGCSKTSAAVLHQCACCVRNRLLFRMACSRSSRCCRHGQHAGAQQGKRT